MGSNIPYIYGEGTIIDLFLSNEQCWHESTVAVCGNQIALTYTQLDQYSLRLARLLVLRGFKREDVVLCRFRKSPWAVVCFLGVLRAGLAFTPVDPSSPASRVSQIADQTRSRFILESESDTLRPLGLDSWHIDEHFFQALPENGNVPVPYVCGQDLAYVYFTSGSTGKPKGVMVEHGAIANSLVAHGQRLGINEASRVLQATSYTFDPCLTEIFATLIFGGCICVPEDLTLLAEFINTFQVNWAFFTPSTISLINPDEVPCLKTISVGGEALTQDCIDTWASRVHLLNSYGPTEACVFASVATITPQSSRSNIGRAIGCRTWIVDLDNHTHVCAIGEIGELLIEGGTLARGYLCDPKSTAAAFVTWCDDNSPNRQPRRLYKTGDLARLEEDGSTSCLGRKDRQVKIRGQRVELSDIESHIMRHGRNELLGAVVEYINKVDTDHLIAFIALRASHCTVSAEENVRRRDELASHLLQHLPSYMVPNHYIFMESLPTNSSGKTDRSLLIKTFDDKYSNGTLEAAKHTNGASTSQQEAIRAEISRVLSLPLDHIDSSLSFTQLGGNSLVAIKLVARLREQSIHLHLKDITSAEPISALISRADKTSSVTRPQRSTAQNLNLKSESLNQLYDRLGSWAADQCKVDRQAIESIGLCTPFQESLLPSLARKSRSYVAQYSFELPLNVDIKRFKACWASAYKSFPIFRSRYLVTTEDGPIRVVINEDIVWTVRDDEISQLERQEMMDIFSFGHSLCTFALHRSGRHFDFLLTLHHLLFDEWSLQLCLEHVAQLYDGLSARIPPDTSFNSFVDFSIKASLDSSSSAFWRNYLAGFSAPPFPRPPTFEYQPLVRDTISIRSNHLESAVLIRASLALAIGGLTDSTDACFMSVMSGRDAGMQGIDEVIGPTLATIPVRIFWDSTSTVASFIDTVKEAHGSSSQHNHFGLQNIRKTCPGATNACNSQTMLVIQAPSPRDKTEHLFAARKETELRNSHALLLECTTSPGGLVVEARFDNTLISRPQCERLLSSWMHMLRQLSATNPNTRLNSLQWISDQDLSTLALWNRYIPDPKEEFAHICLATWAQKQPNKLAVDSWDGSLTYRQLDDISCKLAALLITFSPGQIIPLHFPKGLALVVCMWAVLKSGRAFVLLETEYPTGRITDIVRQLDQPLVLSHDAEAVGAMVSGFCWTVDRKFLTQLPEVPQGWTWPQVLPEDIAFLVMTSGSTGQPKGVMIHHKAIMTTIMHGGPRLGVRQSSRMLLFSSVAFDAAAFVLMAGGVHGACVCVPQQGIGLNELGDFMNQKNVTWSFFTPSFLRLIKPSDLPSLATIVSGGEALTPEAAENWAAHVELINGYGPSECSVCCASAVIESNCANTATIGSGVGCATWIVDPKDDSLLVPIGAVGELLVEGPLVATGYLKDEEKTAASFISPRLSFNTRDLGRNLGRMYKTGDLVRYADNGSLIYVGRRDNQVKLRGQRLELGEIEHHTSIAASGRPVLCFVPKKGILTQRLIAVIGSESFRLVPSAEYRGGALQPDERIAADIRSIKDTVSRILPSYMVPERIAIMSDIPTSINGKMDRKTIGLWIDNLAAADESLLSTGEDGHGINGNIVQPVNSIETILQSVWASVLGLSLDKVGTNQSFQALGGDSISAMQAVARSRNNGIEVSIRHVLRGDNIQVISLVAKSRKVFVPVPHDQNDITDQRFALSPMQRAYVALAPMDEVHHFNQSIQVRLRHFISTHELSAAMRAVVARHASLRSNFCLSTPSESTQWVTNNIENSFEIAYSQVSTLTELLTLLKESQTKINPATGPNIYCELVSGPGEIQRMVLVASHLVIDVVSWRLILEDLEAAIKGSSLESRPQGLFKEWCERKLLSGGPKLSIRPPRFDYWGALPANLTYDDTARETLEIDAEVTTLSLGKSNDCLHTKPTDLFIAALLLAFKQTFYDREPPSVCVEGHGRSPTERSIDVSDTVGWFTSVLAIEAHASYLSQWSPIDLVSDIKDQRVRGERNGEDFFANQEPSSMSIPEVVLNFLGAEHTANHDAGNGLFLADPDSHGDQYDFSKNMRRFAVFDVSICDRDGRLAIELLYNRSIKHSEQVAEWLGTFGNILARLCTEIATASPRPTLSDFPNATISYVQLQSLQVELQKLHITMGDDGGVGDRRVSSIYSATPAQTQMLMAQQANPDCWYPSILLKVTSRDGSPLVLQKLSNAWQQVVHTHPILRTVFLPNRLVSGSRSDIAGFLGVVLQDITATVNTIDATQLLELPAAEWQLGRSQHRLTIAMGELEANSAICRLDINHALIDYISMPIILETLSQVYNGEASHDVGACSYEEYASQLSQMPADASIAFWSSYLHQVPACNLAEVLPDMKKGETFYTDIDMSLISPRLEEAAKVSNSTAATICRLAWALVISKYVGSDDVVFGFVVSGRDAPIENIDRVVGPTMNIIACRAKKMHTCTKLDLIGAVKTDFIAASEHQHHFSTYLIHLQQLGGPVLFDSVVNFRGHAKPTGEANGGLNFEEWPGSKDPFEYTFVLEIDSYEGVGLEASLCCWSHCVSTKMAKHLAADFGTALAETLDDILCLKN